MALHVIHIQTGKSVTKLICSTQKLPAETKSVGTKKSADQNTMSCLLSSNKTTICDKLNDRNAFDGLLH